MPDTKKVESTRVDSPRERGMAPDANDASPGITGQRARDEVDHEASARAAARPVNASVVAKESVFRIIPS